MDGKIKGRKGGRNRRYSRRELHSVIDSEDNDDDGNGAVICTTSQSGYTKYKCFEFWILFSFCKIEIVSKVIIFVSKQV